MKLNLSEFLLARSIVLAHPVRATTEGSYSLENYLVHFNATQSFIF